MFDSQGQAKQFFVEKIVAEARFEGMPFSDDERWMLSFSESDPDFVVDPERVERLEAEISDEDYEAKVEGLLRRSYERDTAALGVPDAMYRDAHATLSQGDHYLLVMIERALDFAPSRDGAAAVLSPIARVGCFLLLVPPGSLAILVAVGLTVGIVSNQPHSVREALPFALGALIFGGLGIYLIRLWLRESKRRTSAR